MVILNIKNWIGSILLSLKRIWLLISMTWQYHPLLTLLWNLFLLTASGFPALNIWLQKQIINNISLININSQALQTAVIFLIIYYASNIISTLWNESHSYLFMLISETVNYRIRQDLLRKAVRVRLENYEEDDFYNRLMMANESVNRKGIEVVNNLFVIIQQIIALLVVYSMLASVHWSLPIALLISSMPGIILLLIAKNRKFNMTVETTPMAREMNYTNTISIAREYAREIRVFKLGEYLIQKWGCLFSKVRSIKIKLALNEAKGKFAGVTVLQFSALIVAILLVYQIEKGYLTIGDYVALVGAVASVQGIIATIGVNVGNIVEISLYNNALFDLLEMDDGYILEEEKLLFPKSSFDKIIINKISFSYPKSNRKVIDNVSMVIKRGEQVAIVGENGAGKTTLVNCILGLYKVTEGNIFVGNVEISNIDQDSLRENISAVFQDFAQYNYCARENVGFGNLHKIDDDEAIIKILDRVGLKEKVENLGLGLDTPLGKEFRDGQDLSGGEWQRIAIARALIKDAEIIALDEPTASLDPLAELDIFRCFYEIAKNKTSIIISHRLGPARFADRIIVLKGGTIIEEGKHEDLLKLNGEYARMFLAQSEWYQDHIPTILNINK